MEIKKQVLLLIIFLISSILFSQKVDSLYILGTNDLHGRIFPYNYYQDEPDEIGLAQIYTRVKQFRDKHSKVILLDAGDAIQGTPLTQYYNFIEPDKPHPMSKAMNIMGYEAFAVGNHEIEQGPGVYNRIKAESNFPWLSANSVLKDSSTYFRPYAIIEKKGIKIGIIGLTTPGIPTMLDQTYYPGITWTDMVTTARKYAEILRPSVDVLVGLFHAGFIQSEDAYKSESMGLPVANASGLVAEQVPEFDVIFGGHSHRIKPDIGTEVEESEKPLQIIAKKWGECLGVAKIKIEKTDGRYRIINKIGWVESASDLEPDKELMELLQPYHDKTLEYIRNDIATVNDTIYGAKSRFEDSPIVELINDAQLAITKADISVAASFKTDYIFKPGKLQLKDVFTIYPYENYLFVVEMTGKQIKSYLEESTKFYIIKNGKVIKNPEVAGYHYSMAEGINYKIELSKPIGRRINNITMEKNNEQLDLTKKYNVAMNSYRANGGGGLMNAAGAMDAPILYKSSQDMRNILIDYLQTIGSINNQVDNNWELEH